LHDCHLGYKRFSAFQGCLQPGYGPWLSDRLTEFTMPARKQRRRAARKPQVPRSIVQGSDTHMFRRTYNVGSFVPAAADFGLGLTHNLTQLPSYAEFSTLFDAYQIDRVDLLFVWRPGAATDGYPTILWCFDPDDATTPATETEMLERQGTKFTAFSSSRSMIRHSYRPRVGFALLTNGGVQRRGVDFGKTTWCDMGATDTAYYGSKVWFSGFNTTITPNASVLVFASYSVKCRYAR